MRYCSTAPYAAHALSAQHTVGIYSSVHLYTKHKVLLYKRTVSQLSAVVVFSAALGDLPLSCVLVYFANLGQLNTVQL
jgi:hypothetical protein